MSCVMCHVSHVAYLDKVADLVVGGSAITKPTPSIIFKARVEKTEIYWGFRVKLMNLLLHFIDFLCVCLKG